MEFKDWLLIEETVTLPISSIIMTKSELLEAVSNITRGYPAMTEGPVEVGVARGRKMLINGYHRMVSFLLEGREEVTATLSYSNWKLPPQKDRFKYQPELPYKGLEDFVEPYLLKRL